jgi:uncharacterized membrane protein YgaE (UPF0421/DUF939 family)
VASDPTQSSARERAALGAGNALVTAGAAWFSFTTSSAIGLREGYWAAISAIVVMQTELQQTEFSGRDRFIGTAIGGFIAWGCAICWHDRAWIYAAAVALSIFVCWLAGLGAAGRLAGVTVSVIVLIPQQEAIWRVALFRFLEVSWGIAVALIVALTASRLLRIVKPS